VKSVPDITYNVFSETLNPAQSGGNFGVEISHIVSGMPMKARGILIMAILMAIHVLHYYYYYYIHLMAFLSRTTSVRQHQKGKPFWILLEQEKMGWQWHELDHMQILCTSLQADNHASPLPLTTHFFTGWMPFVPPNQQCQSTEGKSTEGNHLVMDFLF